ncbi:MAG: hypothetical protein AB8B53_02460 [Flavobacteriales bacterium]
MKRVVYIALLFGLLLSRCTPNELPKNILGDPVFYAEGTIDGTPFSLLAGPDNVEVISSITTDISGIPSFDVEFAQLGCASCESLQIGITGTNEADITGIDQTLPVGSYLPVSFTATENTGEYTIVFSEGLGLSFTLISDDTQEVTILNNNQTFSIEPGSYSYEFISISIEGCSSFVNGILVLDEDGGLYIPQIVTGIDTNGEFLDFSSFSNSSILILNEDGENIAILDEDEFLYLSELDMLSQAVAAIVVLDNSSFGELAITYVFEGGFSFECLTQLAINSVTGPSPLEALTASVSYVSTAGIEYSIPTGSDDFFIINSLTPYLEDPMGREAYTLSFSCGLNLATNTAGVSALQLEITEGIIPIVIE